MLKSHNQYRGNLLPSPYSSSNMIKLRWDIKLSKSSERWANKLAQENECKLEHPDFNTYSNGQNLAMLYRSSYDTVDNVEKKLVESAMENWGEKEMKISFEAAENEKKTNEYFAYNLSISNHYTQLVWAKTTHVGCAYSQCGHVYVTVCEYFPPGNMKSNGVLQEWYIKGPSGSNCPEGYEKHKKLCKRVEKQKMIRKSPSLSNFHHHRGEVSIEWDFIRDDPVVRHKHGRWRIQDEYEWKWSSGHPIILSTHHMT